MQIYSRELERLEREAFTEAYRKLSVGDQLEIFDASADIVLKTGLTHDDAMYLLGKLGMWLARREDIS